MYASSLGEHLVAAVSESRIALIDEPMRRL